MPALNLRNKIILTISLFLLLIAFSIITGLSGLHHLHTAKNEVRVLDNIHDSFDELRILFEKSLMGPHDYLINADGQEKETFQRDYQEIISKKEEVKEMIRDQRMAHREIFQDSLKRAEGLLLIIEEKLPLYGLMAKEIFSLETPEASHEAAFYMEKLDSYIGLLEENLAEESEVLSNLSGLAIERMHLIHNHVRMMLIVLSIATLLTGIVLSFYLTQGFTKPIGRLILTTRKIKGGDLTVRAETNTNDEIAELAGSFNEMVSELADNQERIASILHGSGDAMCVIDRDFNILQLNSQMRELLGMQAKGIAGVKCYDFLPSEICHTDQCVLKKVLTGTKRIEMETRLQPKPGKTIPVDLVATPLKRRGEIAGVIESHRDITTRKISEDALKESERRYRLLVEGLQEGIWVIDRNAYTTFVNPRMAEILGYATEEMLGRHLFSFMGEEGIEKCKRLLERLKRGIKEQQDLEFIRKNSDRVILAFEISPIMDSEGHYIGALAGVMDITDKRRMQGEIENIHRLESIGILAGGIAHDFNNLLTIILGNLSLAKMRLAGEEMTSSMLTQAEKAVFQARDLTKQLLTFSKGGNPLKKIISARNCIEKAASFAIKGSNIRCEYSIQEDLWDIEADEGQIKQVVMNLCTNAREAMPEGGTLKITLENSVIDADMAANGAQLKEGRYIKVVIRDQGRGIPKEELSRVFDPYFSTKNRATQKGMGLGLTIAHSIIKKHGGHIAIDSEPGAWTSVTLFLPASEKRQGKGGGKESASPPCAGGIFVRRQREAVKK